MAILFSGGMFLDFAYAGYYGSNTNQEKEEKTTIEELVKQFAQQGKLSEAMEYFDEALEKNPNDFDAFYGKGLVNVILGQNNLAILNFDEALKINPNATNVKLAKANALYINWDNEEALVYYDEVIESEPNNSQALNNKALTLEALKRYDKALEFFDRAIESDPKSTSTLNNKGFFLDKIERHDESIQAFDKSISIDPLNIDALLGKAFALSGEGKVEEAQSVFQKVLEIEPKNAVAFKATIMASGGEGNFVELAEEEFDPQRILLDFTPIGLIIKAIAPEASAEEDFQKEKENREVDLNPLDKSGQKIPDWIKTTMIWFAEGEISEDEMISAIQFLINEGIIKLN